VDLSQEDEAEAESFRTGTIVFRHDQMGCRHCLLGGGPKLGFKVERGAIGGFLTVSLWHKLMTASVRLKWGRGKNYKKLKR
jgi:hypothetical protein